MSPALSAGYASLWADLGVTHELTISLGTHPARFEPETDFMPILRNLVRRTTRQMRCLPKRQALDLTFRHPDALALAGFYEATDASGQLFPHWHGAVALRCGEERAFRSILSDSIGSDADTPLEPWETIETQHPLISTWGAKPTFDLRPLVTSLRYIRYTTKNALPANVIHWTTADLLPAFIS